MLVISHHRDIGTCRDIAGTCPQGHLDRTPGHGEGGPPLGGPPYVPAGQSPKFCPWSTVESTRPDVPQTGSFRRHNGGNGEETPAALMSRAVVNDDGRAIRLILYSGAGTVAPMVLDPLRAVALAQRLIEAALLRLSARIGT